MHKKQKIFNIKNQTIFGYELLNRGLENPVYSNPLTLIDEAKAIGFLWGFEKIAWLKTFESVAYLEKGEKYSLM